MDTPSPQESSETGKGSGPGQTSKQGGDFGSTDFPNAAAREKHFVSTENVNKGSPENRHAECSYSCNEQLNPFHEDHIRNSSSKQLGQPPEDVILNSNSKCLPTEDAATKNLCAKQDLLELNHGLAPDSIILALQATEKASSENVQNGSAGTWMIKVDHQGVEQSGIPSEDMMKTCSSGPPRPTAEDRRECSVEQTGELHEDLAVSTNLEQLKVSQHESEKSNLKQLASTPEDLSCSASKSRRRGGRNSMKSTRGTDSLRSSIGSAGDLRSRSQVKSKVHELSNNLAEHGHDASKNCDLKNSEGPLEGGAYTPSMSKGRFKKGKHARRHVENTRVLRSMSQEKSKEPEPSNDMAEQGDTTDKEKRRMKRKKKRVKKTTVDEFSRIRTHLRYLLNRMNYEQNLIDAYSGEGWKGQSLEKIKPEKELQRAKSEIFRCKLRIRDLFQRLDSSIAVGRLPESLFDSEGLIDSEDIFCAKCGSKDLPADNDIILCDGACERGFHQFCLQPPLLKEHIPPGNEGWLCPGCDCKVDCIDLLNDSQGTKLSLIDNWEKVFPEAAAAAAASGNGLDNNLGLPSDDSEDNDYDPDNPEVDEAEGDESSSDDSDLYSASESFGDSAEKIQNLDIPSDDSEDDDYDPNAPELEDKVKQESSSSDFTSDSEDLSVAFDNETMPDKPLSALLDHTNPHQCSDGERSKVSRGQKQSLNDELLSLLESGPSVGESTHLSGKRHVERFDYKKLYDETYGNDSSDSSDEDFMDSASKKRRMNKNENVGLGLSGERSPITSKDMKHSNEGNEHAHKRGAVRKMDVERSSNSLAKSIKDSSVSCSSPKRPEYRRLGEVVTQGLVQSFKENQYPDRATKEKLAKELGISVHQVSKWFENARWSFRHTSRMESKLVGSSPSKGTPPTMKADAVCNGVKNNEPSKVNASASIGNSFINENSRQKSTTSMGHEGKNQINNQGLDHNTSIQETKVHSEKGRKRGRPRKNRSTS
ncbi:hypothetical protein NMG60_11021213 [Bertholletia excelsa]